MKKIVKLIAIGAVGLLLSITGCKLDNINPDTDGANTGTGTGTNTGTGTTTKISKSVFINNIAVAYKKGAPSRLEFTNNVGTDIIVNVTQVGNLLSTGNASAANITLSNVTDNSLTAVYSNTALSTNDSMPSDAIDAAYSSVGVYIIIPVDNLTYGYDEIHAYLNNDGVAGAGKINITGNNFQLTTDDVQNIFITTIVTPATIVIK